MFMGSGNSVTQSARLAIDDAKMLPPALAFVEVKR
jgi:hypothetical protein